MRLESDIEELRDAAIAAMSEEDKEVWDALEELAKHPAMRYLVSEAREGHARVAIELSSSLPNDPTIPILHRAMYFYHRFSHFIEEVRESMVIEYMEKIQNANRNVHRRRVDISDRRDAESL